MFSSMFLLFIYLLYLFYHFSFNLIFLYHL